MGLIFRLVELLIVIVPLVGVMLAAVKAVSAARGRHDDEPRPEPGVRSEPPVRWRPIERAAMAHDRTDTRWLDYELDIGKLLDFPLMTDVREPLTQRFHRAKLRADFLRPADDRELLDDRDAAREYIAAVEDYVSAFDLAEAEAIRKRLGDFSPSEQQRLARAQSALRIAADDAATLQERGRAFEVARRELDGLIVLPERTRAEIERGIAGELDS